MRALLSNLPLKLVSLALATLLWFLIAGEKTSEMGVTAPVELQNFPRDLELSGETVNHVDVRLRGSPGMIQRILPGDVSAQVDLAGVGSGEHIVHLTPESIRMPFGVTVVKITPSELRLRLEHTLQKVLEVRPQVVGTPAPGFEVQAALSEPAEVRVAGPSSLVEAQVAAYSEPVSVDGARADVVRQVNVGLQDPLLRLLSDPRARVTVRIAERQERRVFERPVALRDGGVVRTRPAAVRVVLAGPLSLLESVEEKDVHAFVDAAARGEAPVTAELVPPRPGVRVEEVQPASVRVYNRK